MPKSFDEVFDSANRSEKFRKEYRKELNRLQGIPAKEIFSFREWKVLGRHKKPFWVRFWTVENLLWLFILLVSLTCIYLLIQEPVQAEVAPAPSREYVCENLGEYRLGEDFLEVLRTCGIID